MFLFMVASSNKMIKYEWTQKNSYFFLVNLKKVKKKKIYIS